MVRRSADALALGFVTALLTVGPMPARAERVQGWYLIVPPTIDIEGDRIVELTAPLYRWQVRGVYDTAENCQAALREILAGFEQMPPHSRYAAMSLNLARHGRCIAGTDPQLVPPR